MSSTPSAESNQHREAAEKLLKARQVAANALSALADAEDVANLHGAADEHRIQAADEEMNVAAEAEHMRKDLQRGPAEEPPASNNGTVPQRVSPQKTWVTGQPKK
jgi:hypothetical protein